MTLFEQLLIRGERWIEAIQVERDLLSAMLSGTQYNTPDREAFIKARLDHLEKELAEAIRIFDELKRYRHFPGVMFEQRPRMAKVVLLDRGRKRERKRRSA